MGDDLIKRVICISILILFLMSCSSNKKLSSNPDFQGTFFVDDEKMSIVVVDMNMTEEDKTNFNYPDEWEGYVVKWNENTIFLDEIGTEITEGEFLQHDFNIKIWTKEPFKSELTKLVTSADEKLEELYPVYTARQMQLVEMKIEDYLARHVSFEEGELAVRVFLGEEVSSDEKTRHEFQTELNELIQNQSNVQSYEFILGEANKRDLQFIKIDQYPVYLIFDNEKIIFKTYEQEEFAKFIENY